MYVLGSLEPKNVFMFFEEISRIPRGSGNEKAVSDYLVKFAKDRGFEVIQDKALNVIIKKPGTKGYENSPTVIIQGHMDMVCEKNQSITHDFEKDPIDLVVDGDWVRANGTTLGADNGIAVAYAMAVLDDKNMSHPPIEVLITTDEEVGMGGANALDPSCLTGKRLINLDVSPEGSFFAGCAGGMRQVLTVDITWEDAPEDYKAYKLSVRGLKGGHSGGDIHKELGNSNKLLGRALNRLNSDICLKIASVSGGSKENAIPREADAVILVKDVDKAKAIVNELNGIYKNEYRVSDKGVTLSLEDTKKTDKVFSKDTAEKVIKAYMLIPCGLIAKSLDIKGLTETSSNLGVVITDGDVVKFCNATRSSVKSRKYFIKEQFMKIAEAIGIKYKMGNEYPAWEYNPDSYLRKVAVETYEKMFNEKAIVTATHGGLECGLFTETMPGADFVAFGPTAEGAHTPEERLSIESTARTWELIKKLLENLKD
ncbi:MAG: aminoacyl-histidine dipeptidase [Clostridiales bacterium]|jgi:dipeptidase D|nr:aminoacyl-histidine dipeptidase [Clostridiales bacterium]